MVASRTECNFERLAKLLSDELPELEEARATDHISHCSTCRSRLQELAAGNDWWQETSDQLQGSRWQDDGTLWLTSRDFGERAGEITEPLSTSLDFLEPSDNPAMLGRLGTYEILAVIGSGGFGIVLKGFDRELNRYVAVKVLAPHLSHNAAARKRFAREAQAAAAVVHPHVVAIHTVDPSGKLPFLVMPLIAGESLQDRLNREGCLEVKEILRIGMQIAQGLAAAHAQGVVHRDVKPANILLERGVDRVMLTDFGLARAMDDASLTRSTVIAGTPQYMSPEQAHGNPIDHRTDLFSLGSVLYAMCTGHPPFRAETLMGVLRRITDGLPREIREVNPDIPQWLCAIIVKLHATNASDRFQSAAEVADLLERCLAHLQQPTLVDLPETPGRHLSSLKSKSPVRVAIAGACLAAAVIGIGFTSNYLLQLSSDSSNANPTNPNPKSNSSPSVPTNTAINTVDSDSNVKWRDDLDSELWQIDFHLRELEDDQGNDQIPMTVQRK